MATARWAPGCIQSNSTAISKLQSSTRPPSHPQCCQQRLCLLSIRKELPLIPAVHNADINPFTHHHSVRCWSFFLT
jgi:hypothetical protein